MSTLPPSLQITYDAQGGGRTVTHSRYTLRVMCPDIPEETPEELAAALSEAEENIADVLPEGWYVKIEEENPQ